MTETCSTCGDAAKGGMCERCIAFETDFDDNDCGNCGGEGFIYDCFEEWACVDPESGCDLCMRRCDWCTPSHQTKEGGHG